MAGSKRGTSRQEIPGQVSPLEANKKMLLWVLPVLCAAVATVMLFTRPAEADRDAAVAELDAARAEVADLRARVADVEANGAGDLTTLLQRAQLADGMLSPEPDPNQQLRGVLQRVPSLIESFGMQSPSLKQVRTGALPDAQATYFEYRLTTSGPVTAVRALLPALAAYDDFVTFHNIKLTPSEQNWAFEADLRFWYTTAESPFATSAAAEQAPPANTAPATQPAPDPSTDPASPDPSTDPASPDSFTDPAVPSDPDGTPGP